MNKKFIKCPTCEKEVEWSDENPWRPFCSDRCRMIDLGEWVNETRKIPAEDTPLSEEMDKK